MFGIDNLCHLWTKLYFSLPNLYTFYFFFWSYCTSQDSQSHVGKGQWEAPRWPEGSSQFLVSKCEVGCRVCVDGFHHAEEVPPFPQLVVFSSELWILLNCVQCFFCIY